MYYSVIIPGRRTEGQRESALRRHRRPRRPSPRTAKAFCRGRAACTHYCKYVPLRSPFGEARRSATHPNLSRDDGDAGWPSQPASQPAAQRVVHPSQPRGYLLIRRDRPPQEPRKYVSINSCFARSMPRTAAGFGGPMNMATASFQLAALDRDRIGGCGKFWHVVTR